MCLYLLLFNSLHAVFIFITTICYKLTVIYIIRLFYITLLVISCLCKFSSYLVLCECIVLVVYFFACRFVSCIVKSTELMGYLEI